MTKVEYYLGIAMAVSQKSTCLKKQYGAVIVKDDQVIATGYNGNCRGEPHCLACTKKSGDKDMAEYLECKSVHAEMNAIISASRNEMLGSDLYLAGTEVRTGTELIKPEPCEICLRLIKNAGINRIITRNGVLYERNIKGILINRTEI